MEYMQCEPNLCFSSATKNLEKGSSPKPATLLDTVRSGRRHASRHSVNEPTVFWGKVPTPLRARQEVLDGEKLPL